ncbi:hypothetical protein [Clostridium amazonitimonense]|uniref:hypothetical protein n=1 Tax=Clostridium amazonitimonense TaxID=1499689 RepID=UPI000A5DC53F|nr:hypothetical protein [Clostridium amazonitimonense]
MIEDKTSTEYVKEIIKDVHNKSNKAYGSIKIRKKLNQGKNPGMMYMSQENKL